MPDDLGDLSLLLAPAVGEPGPRPAEHHLAAGRHALRRRRLVVGTATLVTLGVIGVGAAAIGSMTPLSRSVDPAAPTPSAVPSPDPRPDPRPDASPGTTGLPAPDVIGEVRTATSAEVATMRAELRGIPVTLDADGDVVVLPTWEVSERFDDLGTVADLNRRVNPDDIRDAVALAVAPRDDRSRLRYYVVDMGERGPVGWTRWDPDRLTGSLAWWATQQVFAGTPRSNGTPGVDVRLRDDGLLDLDEDVQLLEATSDPDLGTLVRTDQELTLAARLRLADGRVLFVVATKGPEYSGTMWFQPEPAPDDVAGFAALVREVYAEPPR